MKKCGERDKDLSNILCGSIADLNAEDDRPVFIYDIDKIPVAELESLANSGRQVFIACLSSVPGIDCENFQICFADIA
jgi:hypothetical protein